MEIDIDNSIHSVNSDVPLNVNNTEEDETVLIDHRNHDNEADNEFSDPIDVKVLIAEREEYLKKERNRERMKFKQAKAEAKKVQMPKPE